MHALIQLVLVVSGSWGALELHCAQQWMFSWCRAEHRGYAAASCSCSNEGRQGLVSCLMWGFAE